MVFKKISLFIYFERERMSRGRAEREGDRIANRLCPISMEPDQVGVGVRVLELTIGETIT